MLCGFFSFVFHVSRDADARDADARDAVMGNPHQLLPSLSISRSKSEFPLIAVPFCSPLFQSNNACSTTAANDDARLNALSGPQTQNITSIKGYLMDNPPIRLLIFDHINLT